MKIKGMLFAGVFAVLTACGAGDGIEGKFRVDASVYGVSTSGNVLIEDGVVTGQNNQTFEIDSWSREGDVYTALDKAGNKLVQVQQIDSDTFKVLNVPGEVTWTRI